MIFVIERCLDAGMDDYVTKPIQTAALLGAIEAVLGSAAAPGSHAAAPAVERSVYSPV